MRDSYHVELDGVALLGILFFAMIAVFFVGWFLGLWPYGDWAMPWQIHWWWWK